jgi:hypothetical protein
MKGCGIGVDAVQMAGVWIIRPAWHECSGRQDGTGKMAEYGLNVHRKEVEMCAERHRHALDRRGMGTDGLQVWNGPIVV